METPNENEVPEPAGIDVRVDALVMHKPLNYVIFAAENVLSKGFGFCPSCGVVSHDEDGCCQLCGALAAGNAIATLMADIYKTTSLAAKAIQAARGVLSFRVNEPCRGELRDNDRSRDALELLTDNSPVDQLVDK